MDRLVRWSAAHPGGFHLWWLALIIVVGTLAGSLGGALWGIASGLSMSMLAVAVVVGAGEFVWGKVLRFVETDEGKVIAVPW